MSDMLAAALEFGANGWEVLPLNGKLPALPVAHADPVEQKACGGRCGRDGHGVLDATTDPARIAAWWAGRNYNIGARVPDPLIVIDVDPRHGGHHTLADLEADNGQLPDTLGVMSGRGDGGRHLFYLRPVGKLSAARLGAGLDLKTHTGYTVVPPSIHPDSGQPYLWEERPPVRPPDWLTVLLRPPPPASGPRRRRRTFTGPSIADQYSDATSWAEVLQPHGWTPLDPDPDADGARWLHPAATSKYSATVCNGCLFVYSTNTPFPITESGRPNGITRFRAYAILNHRGDMAAAARHLRSAVSTHRPVSAECDRWELRS
jgi:hypothetical protein